VVIGEVTGNPPSESEIVEAASNLPSPSCHPGGPVYDRTPREGDKPDDLPGHGMCTEDELVIPKHYGIDAI
jgi:hypothetical protein